MTKKVFVLIRSISADYFLLHVKTPRGLKWFTAYQTKHNFSSSPTRNCLYYCLFYSIHESFFFSRQTLLIYFFRLTQSLTFRIVWDESGAVKYVCRWRRCWYSVFGCSVRWLDDDYSECMTHDNCEFFNLFISMGKNSQKYSDEYDEEKKSTS